MERLASQLRAARVAQKVTLKDLANKSGVHWVTLSRFENGRVDLGVTKLERVAQVLGLELTLKPAKHGYTLDDLAAGYLEESDRKREAGHRTTSLLKQVRGLRR